MSSIFEGRRNSGAGAILETIYVRAPASVLSAYRGECAQRRQHNSVTLSPDESQLYVTNGNLNAVGWCN